MSVKGWPEILLPCKHGHESPSKAGPGKVDCRVCRRGDCPECGPEGRRVALWVSRNRPRTEREARDRAEQADRDGQADPPAAGSELASRWEREAPWDGHLITLPGRAGDDCPECGQQLQWEPGRTLVCCPSPSCRGGLRLGLPAAVADHYQRQNQRSAEVAAGTTAPDQEEEEDQAARVQVNALAQRMTDEVNDWVDKFDPDGLSGSVRSHALNYRAKLSAWLPEIDLAWDNGDRAGLVSIAAKAAEIVNDAGRFGILAAIEHQRSAAGRQAELPGPEAGRPELAGPAGPAIEVRAIEPPESARQAKTIKPVRSLDEMQAIADQISYLFGGLFRSKPKTPKPAPEPAEPQPDPDPGPYRISEWG